MNQLLVLNWLGPFSWPGFEPANNLEPIPAISGVYLQAFQNRHAFAVYAAGITRRRVAVRFKEHTRKYLNGEYTVLDVASAQQGIRNEIWHGWEYARSHRDEFVSRQDDITEAARKQLAAFRIFVAQPGNDERTLERIEATVMDLLYRQPAPLRDLPDRGMHLAPRRDTEAPIPVGSHCEHVLLGIPSEFAI